MPLDVKSRRGDQVRLELFFEESPVFTTRDLKEFLKKNEAKSLENYSVLLNYHVKRGRVLKICRGLYAVVPLNQKAEQFAPDSFLIAGKRTEDAILAYHTAQEFNGNTYSLFSTRTFLTMKSVHPLLFREIEYIPTHPSQNLLRSDNYFLLTEQVDIKGINVLITSRERTFADMLDRPNLCGGIEEVWRSLKMTEYLNTENLLNYLRVLDNSTTSAKVGFFLQRHPKITNNDRPLLRELKKMIPVSPHYFDRSRLERARLVKDWNLVIPEYILNERWEEQ